MSSTRLWYLAAIFETTPATAVKPTNFLRFKDWDILANQEIIENNPIQNNRWGAINAVEGKKATEWSYNLDLDYNECVFFLKAALGSLASADISSLTDGSVYRHTLTVENCSLPALTLEQWKGNLGCSGDTHNQAISINRAFWVLVDTLTLSASEGIVNMAVWLKAHGLFQKSDLIWNAGAWAWVDLSLETVEGLTTSDSVTIYDTTPQSEVDAIASIDTANKTIEIATLANSYTVANEAKVWLIAQTASYWTEAKIASFTHAWFQFADDLTAAASATETNVENWEITFENQLEERYWSLRSSPSVIAAKGAMMKMTYTRYFENVEDRDTYLRLKKQACIVTLNNNEIVSATDTNDEKFQVIVKISDLRLTSYELPTGSDELYAASVEGTCFYDSSDWKAVQFEVVNEKAGTVYS